MGGTDNPDPDATYIDLQGAIDDNTPNAGDRVIIVGYSQSASIATTAKRPFIENYASDTAGATTRKPRRPSGIAPGA